MAGEKVFLDVGANTGQSLKAVLGEGFDRIVCFEPASACWDSLAALADERTTIERFGLWKDSCELPIFQPGSKGAGIFKKDKGTSDATELCQFRKASDWFRENIKAGDIVYLKLNCEGAECDVLDDLLDSGEFEKVTYTMIDFDVRKIASQKHRQAEVLTRLAPYAFPRFTTSRQVMIGGTHQERIKNWLRVVEGQ